MSIKKQILKTKPVCKVTFEVPVDLVGQAENVSVVGEFNAWNPSANPLKKNAKTGVFSATLELEKEKEFQFKYLIGESNWQNEPEADKYVETNLGTNSVVVCS